jgi:hypothetical protein
VGRGPRDEGRPAGAPGAARRATAAIEQAQNAGVVSKTMPPAQLLDHILTLAHGHPLHAGDATTWTDERRRALATAVATLTGQQA